MKGKEMYCLICVEEVVEPARVALGYRVCLSCGDKQAKGRRFTVAPMHKSNYMLITDTADLKGLNNKGGLVK
jgi:ribosomal protein L37AE/L43A